MAKLYKVQADWLKKKDSLNHVIGSWCKILSDVEVVCSICNKNISCEKKGYAAITQHVKTKLHMENASVKLEVTQLLLAPRPSGAFKCTPAVPVTNENSSSSSTSSQLVSLVHSEEDCVRAELIWAMKTVVANIAPAACEDLKDVFKAMFKDAVPEKFSLGRTKLGYLITEALGPYFLDNLLQDLKNVPFSLLFDETTNNSNQKELQVAVRFWSESETEVVNRHLKTIFMGHATADDLADGLKRIIDTSGLSFKDLLMLGSDGPNVNKKVSRIINHMVKEERGVELIDIGTCNLHVIHNAYLKGLAEYGEVAKELVIDIYHFFKKYPSRWEDFMSIQIQKNCDSKRFMKHSSTRWLTLAPAAERLLSQWPAVVEYFFKFIPVKQPNLLSVPKYKRIVEYLKYVDIQIELQFITESAELFSPFLTLFQKSAPLIHVLYSEVIMLLKKICGRIAKPDTNVYKAISSDQLLAIADLWCGQKIRDLLSELKAADKKMSQHKMQQHYLAAFNYLQGKIVGTGKNALKYLQCLQPSEVAKEKSVRFACHLAKMCSFLDIDEMSIRDEWLILQTDFIVPSEKDMRIDHVWRSIFEKKTSFGMPKYPNVTTLVKACLSLSHGNSDVERGFSISSRILSEEKSSMSEKMLNARLNVRDGLKKYSNISEFPISRSLLNMAFNAYNSYRTYLDEQKRLKDLKAKEAKEKEEEKLKLQLLEKDLLEKKENITTLESKVEELSKQKNTIQATADVLLKEGNERLRKAIAKNNLAEIHVSQSMLEAAEKMRDKERVKEKKTLELSKKVEKRKSSLIDYLIKDPKKIKKV